MFIENLNYKVKGEKVFENLSLSFNQGEITALIGENGSGKTSLLTAIYKKLNKNKEKTIFVFDKPALYPDWKVGIFLNWIAQMQGIKDKNFIAEIIASCELQEVLNKECKSLSHGFRQRVALAQGLIAKPKILLLDEPSNGLDAKQQKSFREIISLYKKNCAVLMVHHDLNEVIKISDKIYELRAGKIKEITTEKRDFPLWCIYENQNLALENSLNADEILENCLGFYFNNQEDREKKVLEVAKNKGLVSLSFNLPLEAFLLKRELLWQ